MKLTKIAIALLLTTSFISYSKDDVQTTDELLGDPSIQGNYRADDVPSGDAGRSFMPGMSFGDDSVKGASYSNSLKIDANFKAYANLSCGNFDFTDLGKEIERQVNRISEKAKQMPEMLVGTFGAVISTLDTYIIAKYNPALYQLMQKGIDEYAHMLEVATKSCRDIENEIAANADGNPYENLIKVAIGDQWKRNVDTYNTSSETLDSLERNTVEEAKKAGIVLADGKSYGGDGQDPINLTKSITIAGVNMLVGRTNKDEWENDFVITDKAAKRNPLYIYFKSPNELYEFIRDIYGSTETVLVEATTPISRTPGRGYEKKYLEIRNELYPLIKDRISKKIKRFDFEDETGIIIAPATWDDIRILPSYQRAVEIEALTKRESIKKLKEQLLFAKSAIRAGIYSPDLQTSSTREQATIEYKKLYYQISDDIAEIQQRMYQ